MAPKTKARKAAPPQAPKAPPPPDLQVPTLAPDMEMSPDWLEQYLRAYYAPEIKKAEKTGKAIEAALARGDYATAEKLDAQLEEFYEKVDSQLEEITGDDDAAVREKGSEEQQYGGGTPSVVEQIRDTYGRYLRGDFADGTMGSPDFTPEQNLASRIRSSLAGEGWMPTGDDLRTVGDDYNPNGFRDAFARVSGAPDEQINDMARDLFEAHEAIKGRQKQGGSKSEALVRFMSKYGPYAPALLALAQSQEAEAAGRGPRYNLARDGMPIQDAIRIAARDGLPDGGSVASGNWGRYLPAPQLEALLESPEARQTLDQIAKALSEQGINKVVPLAAGRESAVFDAGDKVAKLGQRFTYGKSYTEPQIWGVLPTNTSQVRFPLDEYRRDYRNMDVITQPRAELGTHNSIDMQALEDAINRQGFAWRDAGLRNMGMLPGADYRPVVIDGPVRPLNLPGFQPIPPDQFVPPTWADRAAEMARRYGPTANRVIPVLAAMGATTASQALGGNTPTPIEGIAGGGMWTPQYGLDPLEGWRPPQPGMFERVTGGDWSMDISPQEQYAWYTNPELGYNDDNHRQYIQNAEKLLDVPLIPAKAAMDAGYLGSKTEGDITLREFLASAPMVAAIEARKRFEQDPTPQNREAFEKIFAATAPGVSGDPSTSPIVVDAWRELTGQQRNRGNLYGQDVAQAMLGALKAGATGGTAEDDPSWSQSQFDELKDRHGEERAYAMVAPGGVRNAQREAAYDFLASLQSGPQYAPNVDTLSAAMALVAPGQSRVKDQDTGKTSFDRYETLMDESSHRGRMRMANDRFAKAWQSFEEDAKTPETPYEFQAENFNRTDPGSVFGLFNLAGNSSNAYGRAQNNFRAFIGDSMTRGGMMAGPTDLRPLRFFADTYNRTSGEAKVRPDSQTPEQFRQTRDFADRRKNTGTDYWESQFADWAGRRPYGIESSVIGAITDPPNSLGQTASLIVGGGLPAVMGKGVPLGAAAADFAKEVVVDENVENAILDPHSAASLFTRKEGSSWERPLPPNSVVGTNPDGTPRLRTTAEYARMFDPANNAEYSQNLKESADQDRQELGDQYGQWLRSRPSPVRGALLAK